MQRCVRCKGRKFERTEDRVERTVGEQKFAAAVPAERCVTCGETYFSLADLTRFEHAIAAQLVESGQLTGAAFKFLRKTMGLRESDLAKLLDVAAATVSRWESGQRAVDRVALSLLGVLVLEYLDGRHDTLDRLRALDRPRRRAKVVRLKLGDVKKAS